MRRVALGCDRQREGQFMLTPLIMVGLLVVPYGIARALRPSQQEEMPE
jgi:hypothetical protein